MKNKHKKDNHHRLPSALGGTDDYPRNNLVHVPVRKHRAWHTLFSGDMTLEQIVHQLNETWIDPRFILRIEKREENTHISGQLKIRFP